MADENGGLTVDVGSEGSVTSFDGTAGTNQLDQATSIEFGRDGKPVVALDPEAEAAAELGEQEGTTSVEVTDPPAAEEVAAEEETTPEEEAPAADALPDFEVGNEEVLAQYDARYFNEEGTELNIEAFDKELAANIEAGKADLNAGTRAYLKDRLGISDKLIDQHLAGLVAQRDAADNEFYAAAGGKDAYEAQLAWAKADGGYTAEQKARFNKALQAGGEEAKEALELLKSRFTAKNPGLGDKTPAARRPGAPKRVATTNAASAVTEAARPFETSEEHRIAQNEALQSGDPKKIEAVRKRLLASPKLLGK